MVANRSALDPDDTSSAMNSQQGREGRDRVIMSRCISSILEIRQRKTRPHDSQVVDVLMQFFFDDPSFLTRCSFYVDATARYYTNYWRGRSGVGGGTFGEVQSISASMVSQRSN